ncbi:MAG: hypothetical protein U5R06_16025 [candidate division KSB1 bacterium]|nr:hypothetical protein [candidate division KSB1 bacterium]
MINERITQETGNLKLAIAQTEQRLDNRITTELSKVNERMTEEIGKVNVTIADVEKRLDSKIEHTRADLIKWMFIFWIGQVGALLGILFAFFK